MRIEPISPVVPKLKRTERPEPPGAWQTEVKLHLNDPESSVAPVSPATASAPADDRQVVQSLWLDECERAVLRVLDRETGEVISQLPSEQVLQVSERIGDLLRDEAPPAVDIES